METIQSVVKGFLAKRGWRAERRGERLLIHIKGDHGYWGVFVNRNEDDRWLVVCSIAGFNVPVKTRQKVAEFVARVNYGMILGGFELDMDDGEVSYKTSLRLPETELTHELLEPLFFVNLSTFDRFLPGLYALVYGRRSVARALDICGVNPVPVPSEGVESETPQEQAPEGGEAEDGTR